MIFLPMMKAISSEQVFTMDSTGFSDMKGELVSPTWVLLGLNALIVLLSFIAIFLYKNRTLQMRMTMFNLILKPGFYGLAYYYLRAFAMPNTHGGMGTAITPWLVLPIVAMIFDYLAHRGIAIDDRTIKYMDRLR